jgi:transposase
MARWRSWDLQELEVGYSDEGHPAYHPALLLKVWLYAYALGMTSSRRLEQRIREDLAFRYLAGAGRSRIFGRCTSLASGTGER